MLNIKFINATNVELRTVGNPSQITYTLSNNQFSCSNNFFSKDDQNYYYFAISGQNVQLSGQITQVTEDYQFFNLFRDQPAIVDASKLELQAPTVKKFSYANMFLDCQNLTSPPTLSATTLDQWCYSSMFGNCYKLATAPALIATTLAKYCYYCMFYNCWQLVESPTLPASTLTDWCYNSMFYNCQNLSCIASQFTDWSPSNATTNWVTRVAQSGWFNNQNITEVYGVDNIPSGWTIEQPQPPAPDPTISIASIPDLVWDFETNTTSSVNLTSYITYSNGTGTVTYDLGGTLANGVVFNNGILSANKDLMEDDFSQNFTLSASATDITSTATENFSLIISGVYQQPPVPVPTITIATIPAISWDFEEATTSSVNLAQYVTYSDGSSTLNYSIVQTLPSGVVFENGILSANKSQMTEDITSTLTLSAYASDAGSASAQFSFAVANVEEPEPPVPVGDPLTFKSTGTTAVKIEKQNLSYKKNNNDWTDYYMGYITLNDGQTVSFSGSTSDRIGEWGNNVFITSGDGTLQVYGNPHSLINWTDMQHSYEFACLFMNCQNLVDASNLLLPATTLTYGCYMSMFQNTPLTAAPVLPATTLAEACYYQMFEGCFLTTPPELPATTLAESCYTAMFSGCVGLTGINLPATGLARYCYNCMFQNCSNLSTITLPATTLVNNCYDLMFTGCTSLTSINVAFTDWNNGNSTDRWVIEGAPVGVFTKPSTLAPYTGNSYIPTNWTINNSD